MIILLVLLAAVVAGVVYAVKAIQKDGFAAPPPVPWAPVYGGPPAPGAVGDPPAGSLPLPPPTAALGHQLERWVAAGLLTEPQSTAILAHEEAALVEAHAAWLASQPSPAPPTRPRRVPVVAEALGYLGGMLAVIGLGLVLSRVWPDMSVAGRAALAGVTALALLGGGALVRDQTEPALVRLRAFLWLASTAATALFVGVLVRDGYDTSAVETVALGCAAAVAAQSGLLWRWQDRPLQQLTFLGGVVVAVGALAAELAAIGPQGIAVAATGAVLLAAGLRRLTPSAVLTEAVGALALLGGVIMISSDDGWPPVGMVLIVIVALGLLALATVPGLAPDRADRVVIGALGGLALFEATPSAIGYFAQDAGVATGLVTWGMGAGLLAVGARKLVLVPHLAEALGAAALLGGSALTGVQVHGLGPLLGAATALGLVALGMLPGQVLLSVFGSLGLLINVPWAIGYFFPGEGRAPLLILVSGGLILLIAVLLTRMAPRFRQDLGGPPRPAAPTP